MDSGEAATLTFDEQGTITSSDNQHASITNGTFKVTTSCDEQKLVSGSSTVDNLPITAEEGLLH
ncbi:MAG: hypothetical protein ACJ70W_05935 [Nitrososphaera sp.]